ncbi:phospholipid transfer protein C2CD2L isoform X2 [Megalops cyprinoides]|uniref:phospholipid transfer protein C2CD2L isoform X2 n=1 Tax=Megalops cyprinoides TaxID=118141 RepID=UPI001863DF73|nr:phospholipid transfer protein C2CD2L isoform X2 [Megalops cyprinoides]
MAVMTLQDMSWLLLVALFLASLLIVLAWLVQYSRAILYSQSRKTSSEKTTRSLPENLSHQSQAGGIWGTLLRLRFNRDGSGGDTEAGVKGLLSSLFSFRSFRENWIRAWVRALNEQAFRDGSSIQITFEDSLQLLSSASISHVSCTDQSANSMVLQCSCEVDIVTFPVTVTQQSPAAVSIDTYQVTAAPVQVQLVVCLEEVEEEGLLVSWTFSQQPQFDLTVSPRRVQREVTEGSDDQVDMNMIAELVEDTLFSTQPTMIINLKSCMSSIGGSGERLILGVSPPSQGIPMLRLVVRQLRAAVVRGGSLAGWAELCCALDLTPPILERRTRFLPLSSGSGMEFEWSEDITLDLGHDTKELKIRLVERNSKGERFLPGHASLLLDVPRKSPVGRHVLSVSPGHGLPSTGNVTFELLFLEPGDPCGSQGGTALRSLITPTKKVEMDRTIMPDGTIVTTVTTIQSRPKLDRKLESPSCSPSKVEVTEKKPTLLADSNHDRISPIPSSDTHLSNGLDPVAETAIRQLTESASKVAKKTPTKRSTLIISGVSKVPIAEDDAALSIGYAAAMDAALQGEQSSGALNHYTASFPGALQHDPDETTPSDISERPSVDDVESETGSTGALETRSLKDHKVGFLRSGTKLLFRRRHGQKDPSLSQSHEDVSNLGNGSAMRKKSGSFSRRLIKRFSFRSKSKGKVSANGGTGMAEN